MNRRQETINCLKTLLSIAEDPNNDTFEHLRLGQAMVNLCPDVLFYIESDRLRDLAIKRYKK